MPKKKIPAVLKKSAKKKPVEKAATAKAKVDPKKSAARKGTANTPPRKEIGKTAKESAAKRPAPTSKLREGTSGGDLAPSSKGSGSSIESAFAAGATTVNPFPNTGGQ